mgnify:CR=1 FL=1
MAKSMATLNGRSFSFMHWSASLARETRCPAPSTSYILWAVNINSWIHVGDFLLGISLRIAHPLIPIEDPTASHLEIGGRRKLKMEMCDCDGGAKLFVALETSMIC